MKSSSLSALDFLKEEGISPKEYRDSLIHDWYLPENIQKKLTAFFLRRIHTGDLFFNLHNGEITLHNTTYSVIWMNKPETVRQTGWALGSFRFCTKLKTGYVLIRVLHGEPENFEEITWDRENRKPK